MPDPTLDTQLRQARNDLLAEIRLPELAGVHQRAAGIRRRRRALTAGTSALALLLVVLFGVTFVDGGGPGPEPAASQDVARPMWQGRGITLYGLIGGVLDQPGDLTDVQFSGGTGFALTEACEQADAACGIKLAISGDGGQSWADWPLPFDGARAGTAHLIALDDAVIVRTDGVAWLGERRDRTWTPVTVDLTGPNAATVDSGSRLTVEPSSCGGSLTVWRPDATAVRLADPPSMIACSVSYASGGIWVGGRTADGSAPAVAVSADAGATWTVTAFPAGQGVASVAAVPGGGVRTVVLVPRGGDPYPQTQTVTAVYASDGGSAFRARSTEAGTAIGDVVPLADGWLVGAGPDWQLSDPDRGGEWSRAGGSLPWVGRIAAIRGGWVAYDLFKAGWAAWSTNGLAWQKINVR